MSGGNRFTVPAAEALIGQLDPSKYKVVFDHGGEESQTIVSWFGESYERPFRPKQLAQLDIAVIKRSTAKIIALVEIEDTAHNTKTLIGDAIAALIGSGIAINNQTHWQIGRWSSLIIFAHFNTISSEVRFRPRIQYLRDQLNAIHGQLNTPNALIGKLYLGTFVDQETLNDQLVSQCNWLAGNKPSEFRN